MQHLLRSVATRRLKSTIDFEALDEALRRSASCVRAFCEERNEMGNAVLGHDSFRAFADAASAAPCGNIVLSRVRRFT